MTNKAYDKTALRDSKLPTATNLGDRLMWPSGLQFSHLSLYTDTLFFFQQADQAEELDTHRLVMNMQMGILIIPEGTTI